MSMLTRASKMAYGKVGIYGEQGSGKSRTAAEIAMGICSTYKLDKPIGVFDTEPGWGSFLVPLIVKAGFPEPFVYDTSRAFTDLLSWTKEAREACSVLIVDSITHVWRDLQVSCLNRINDDQREWNKRPLAKLEFQHWDPVKRQWAEFTDLYLASRVHFILCGRAGSIYEYQENDNGKKELITTGTKMATEKEMGYEPSLLIEMLKVREDGETINTAFIEKDRADKLNGKMIPLPNFAKLKPHFDVLDIGGEHIGSMQQRDSRALFNGAGDDNSAAEMRRRDVALDEIKEELLRHHGHGMDAGTKAAKAATLEQVSGTRSWEKLSSMRLPQVQATRNALWKLTRGHEYGAEPVAPAAPAQELKLEEEIPFGAAPSVEQPKQDAAA